MNQIVDPLKSFVRWEGAQNKLVTKKSSASSIKDMRDTVGQVEAFAYSLAFAFLACDFDSELIIGFCTTCNEGHVVVPASGGQATCPACGATHEIQPKSL